MTEAEAERSEPYIYIFLQTLLLIIFRFTVLRGRRHIMRLLQSGRIFQIGGGFQIVEDDDGDEYEENGWRRRRRRRRLDPDRFPKVPSETGAELMNSGKFGSNEAQAVTSADRNNIGKKKKLALRILDRELATESFAKQRLNQSLMAQASLLGF